MTNLTIGCGAYDRTWPLIANKIQTDEFKLNWEIMPPEEAFLKGMVHHEFDLTEMSFSTYLLQLSRGENAYTAIPVFASRAFRHSAIYIRTGAAIEKPEDLQGRRIGVPEYQLTANVWARGILSDEYGVRSEDIKWLACDIDEKGRVEKVSADLPSKFNLKFMGMEETLWGLMQRGEIDAIIAPRAPKAFTEGDPGIERLFPDTKSAEQDYFKKTGIFPIMHLVGIRNTLLAENPNLAGILYGAFEKARQHAVQELNQVAYFYVMLPWLVDHMKETKDFMGEDYWTYGIAKNRKVIETMCRYSYEQGLAKKLFTADEIFAPV
ncbi:MAG: 4,5-dihydroxyphthalate decarboxylase [Rhodospirillaceae bacterium]|jgi:4,5-dihydroxyphthalate decarboxylase|nr:4,5-dihydroxyphthalate decarboxylase [Rhodospirillaceae bacterium]MDP6925465.1 ABC transporter substrate-binding protein [Rhodospirillales bacterium]|tara:strand:+ start:520 stop:1485 length:966 start_codon:yes stop_codon:yes gene_type:complete